MDIGVIAVQGQASAGEDKSRNLSEPCGADYASVVERKEKERDGTLSFQQREAAGAGAQEPRRGILGSDDDSSKEAFWERKKAEADRLSKRRKSISREAKFRKEQRRQAKLEQEIKRKRRARYVRIMEESSWKRKLQSQEAIRNYYQGEVSAEVVSFIVSDRSVCQGRTEGCVRCTFSGNEPDQLDTVYYTYYSPEGLRCIREGERNPSSPQQKLGIDVLQWEIPLDNEQYEAVAAFLAEQSESADLRFTASESFWREFLSEK